MIDRLRDLEYPRIVLVGLGIVLVVALAVAAGTSSAAFGVYNWEWDGGSALRDTADSVGTNTVIARDTGAYASAEPNGTVAVVLAPDESYARDDAARLREFVAAGGTVVVADDTAMPGNDLLSAIGAGAQLDGVPVRDERSYTHSPAFPVATNVSVHAYTTSVDEFVLNYGTSVDANDASVVIGTSEYAYRDANGNDRLDDAETIDTHPVVTVESVGAGHVIVVSDASALINVMLEEPGNAAFVRTVFGAHHTVLFDVSHTAGPPPLALGVLVVRDSVVLQLVLGLGGLGVIALWARSPGPVQRIRERIRGGDSRGGPWASEAELVATIAARHPSRDRERVQRVVRGIISRRGERERDE